LNRSKIKEFVFVAKTTTDKSTKAASEKTVEGPVKGKKVSPPKAGNAPNALQKPLQPFADLAVIVGSQPLARGEVVSKVWEYIKKNNLQNPANKREIVADEALKKIFGKDKATMFEMNKFFSQHLS
jgi:upstream activation factor subunit UAF30